MKEKLSDTQWRIACETLAKEEIDLDRLEKLLAGEATDWKERKGELSSQIRTKKALVQTIAREVETRERDLEPQGEIAFPSAVPPEEPADDDDEPSGEDAAS